MYYVCTLLAGNFNGCSSNVDTLGIALRFVVGFGRVWWYLRHTHGGNGHCRGMSILSVEIAVEEKLPSHSPIWRRKIYLLQGTWASVIIAVNFVWGILVFREPVKDFWGAFGAFVLLALGLIGMSHYSAPETKTGQLIDSDQEEDAMPSNVVGDERFSTIKSRKSYDRSEDNVTDRNDAEDPLVDDNRTETNNGGKSIVLFGTTLTKRQAGLLGAVFNGLMTGSSLVPLHYAMEQGVGGARYLISFATGAMVANILVWVIFFAYRWTQHSVVDMPGSALWQTYSSLPVCHFQQLWLPGFAAGTSVFFSIFGEKTQSYMTYITHLFSLSSLGVLLTIGMFGSILATTYLGQGIGNSVVQSKILIRYVSRTPCN
jgi:hypothetical protein